MAVIGSTLLLFCSRLMLVVTMKMTKWLYLREVLCCGCSTSTRPRVSLITESVQALLESILYHNMRSLNLLLFSLIYNFLFSVFFCRMSWKVSPGPIFACKTLSRVIITAFMVFVTSWSFSVPLLSIRQSERFYSSDIRRREVTDLILAEFGCSKYLIVPWWYALATYQVRLVSWWLFLVQMRARGARPNALDM